MANEEQHELQAGPSDNAGQPPEGLSPTGAARRRLGKAGLGASGVILTLTSQPGMATTKLMCTSASAYGSFKPVSHKHASIPCDGRSPGYWKNWPRQWYGAYTSPNAKFGAVFKCLGTTAPMAPMTLLEVLGPPNQYKGLDSNNVGMHIVAALLNARSGRVTQLPEWKVLEIWTEYARTRYYSPRKDTSWDGAQIVDYLKSTMG